MSILRFPHRRNHDGTYDSICSSCFMTIATREVEAELEYDIAFLRGDRAGMERVAAQARQRPGGETWISNKEAFALAYSGHLQRARAMSRRAVDHARQEALPERAGAWEGTTSGETCAVAP